MGWDSSESGLFVFLHPGALEPSNLTPLISIRQGMCISFELFSLLSETNSSGLGMDVTSALSVCVRQDLTRKQFYGVVCFWMKSPNRLSGVVPPPIFTSFLLISNVFISTICHHHFHWKFRLPPHLPPQKKPPGSAKRWSLLRRFHQAWKVCWEVDRSTSMIWDGLMTYCNLLIYNLIQCT